MFSKFCSGLVLCLAVLAFAPDVRAASFESDSAPAVPGQEGESPAAHEHIGSAGGVNTSPAEFKIDLAIYTFFVFLFLLVLLSLTAWKPIIQALDAREKHVRDSLAEVERARDQARVLLAEHDKKLADVQHEVRAILDEARRDAQHTQQEILKQAQVEAQAARDRATRDIEQARDRALQELFTRTADLATEVAGRIVRRSLNPQDHRDIVQQVLNDLPSKN